MNRETLATTALKRFLENYTLDNNQELCQTIESCFHLSKEKDISLETKNILDVLLAQTTSKAFNFSAFLSKLSLTKTTEEKFLKAFLYGLYFGDIDLSDYQDQTPVENYEFLVIQILSENTTSEEIEKILQAYPSSHDFSFICFLTLYYREGSQIILDNIEGNHANEQIGHLIINLKRKYYDVFSLKTLLTEEKNEEQIIAFLEQESDREVQFFTEVFYDLIPLMITSSVRVYEALSGKSSLKLISGDLKEVSELRQSNLFNLFRPFMEKPFSKDEFIEFFRLFGLYGDFPFLETEEEDINCSLTQKLESIHDIFSDPLLIIQTDRTLLNIYMAFIKNVLDELEALHRTPEKYAVGLQNTVFVIPTKDKTLETQAAFPAFFNSFKTLLNYLRIKLDRSFRLEDYPLVVLDQSNEALFTENKKYLNHLEVTFQAKILHVSQKDALELAKKQKIDRLIDTTDKGTFGYGGMRNCAFFLAPLIANPKASFNETILGGGDYPHGIGILMLDDDNAIPESNLFCHMHFAANSKDRYTSLACFNTGRYSKMIMYPPLNQLLENPQDAWVYAKWVDDHFSSTMSEYYSNPKICINLPFGGEEGHLDILYENYPLLRCSVHLSGARFPTQKFPTRSFVGLEEKLEGYIRYALNTGLTGWLIDPLDSKNRCALPWNKPPLKETSISSLRDVLNYMVLETTREEMEVRFWKNLADLFSEETFPRMRLKEWIDDLLYMDIAAILQQHEQKQSLTQSEKESLEKIGKIYSSYQKDAHYFMEYGEKVLKDKNLVEEARLEMENKYHIQFADFPFTEGLYLIITKLGCAGFLDDLGIIRTYHCIESIE